MKAKPFSSRVPGLILSVFAAGLAGCSSTPQPTLLTLPALGQSHASAPSTVLTSASPVLSLSRLDLPEYLVSRRVRYRADESTVAEWPDTYWAERVEIGMAREFSAALRESLPAWRICEANCNDQAPAASLHVSVVRLDYLRPARLLHAQVRVVLRGRPGAPNALSVDERSYDIASTADTAQAQAAAFTEVLKRVASMAAQTALTLQP